MTKSGGGSGQRPCCGHLFRFLELYGTLSNAEPLLPLLLLRFARQWAQIFQHFMMGSNGLFSQCVNLTRNIILTALLHHHPSYFLKVC